MVGARPAAEPEFLAHPLGIFVFRHYERYVFCKKAPARSTFSPITQRPIRPPAWEFQSPFPCGIRRRKPCNQNSPPPFGATGSIFVHVKNSMKPTPLSLLGLRLRGSLSFLCFHTGTSAIPSLASQPYICGREIEIVNGVKPTPLSILRFRLGSSLLSLLEFRLRG